MITWISTGSFTDEYPASSGGIQTCEFSIADQLARQKIISPVHIVVIKQNGQTAEESLFDSNLRVLRIPKPYSYANATDTEFRTAFAIRAKQIAHNLVISGKSKIFQLTSAVSGRSFIDWDLKGSFSKELQPKFVYAVHNPLALTDYPIGTYSNKRDEWKVQKDAEEYLIEKADTISCASSWFRKSLIDKYGLDENKIKYIPNTVGPFQYYKLQQAIKSDRWKKTILYLGRLAPEKRVDRVIRLFKLLIEQGKEYSLIIAGDGSEQSNLERLIDKLGLRLLKSLPPQPKCVHMLGLVTGEDKWRIFKSCRILVTLSEHEVSSLVGYEALALGIPLIVSSIPQWNDIVENEKNGFVISGSDLVQTSNAVVRLIESDKLHSQMSEANERKYMSFFDSEIVARTRFEKVYSPLLNEYDR